MAKKKDATQAKGVSEEDKNLKPDTQEEEVETKTDDQIAEEKAELTEHSLTDRQKTIEEIAERIETDRANETGVKEEEEETTELTPEEEEDIDELAEKQTKDKEKAEDVTEKKEDTLEIIVDGVKKIVPVSQVTDAGIRTLQKEAAADARLDEAVKLLKEAKEAAGKKVAIEDEPGKTDDELKELTKGIDKEKITKIREAIQFGDEEEADAALQELYSLAITANKNSMPDNVLTIEKLEEIEKEKTGKEVFRKFNLPPEKGGFSDIVNDRYLYAACKEDVQEELAKGTPNTWELYETIGKNIRQWRDQNIKKPNEDAETAKQKAKDELEAKRQKKAKAAGATITGVNAKTETINKEPKEQTVSDIVNEMRKSRGQPV